MFWIAHGRDAADAVADGLLLLRAVGRLLEVHAVPDEREGGLLQAALRAELGRGDRASASGTGRMAGQTAVAGRSSTIIADVVELRVLQLAGPLRAGSRPSP